MRTRIDPAVSDTDRLWREYLATHNVEAKHALALQYVDVVRMVVRTMNVRTTPPLEESDLEQIGFIGLGDAIDRFDPTRGVKFETYAPPRIRGMIWDELRRLDWVPRAVRDEAACFRRAVDAAQRARNGEATTEEIVAVMHEHGGHGPVAVGELVSIDEDVAGRDGEHVPLRETLVAEQQDVLTTLIEHETRREVERILQTLPPTPRYVIVNHYWRGVAFQEISKELGVSCARVSQIHRQALASLRVKLRELIN